MTSSLDTVFVTYRRLTSTTSWWRLLLAALTAVVAGLLAAPQTALAATSPVVESRVGASHSTATVLVGPSTNITAG